MPRSRSDLIPLEQGPPQFHERQVTPGHLFDMQLGYLGNMGAGVELVTRSTGRIERVTLLAVGRTFWVDQPTDRDLLVTEEGIETSPQWTDYDGVTFYAASQDDDPTYEYGRRPYIDVGLAPLRDGGLSPVGWNPAPLWYLRWPED